jgi:hypothetical protein
MQSGQSYSAVDMNRQLQFAELACFAPLKNLDVLPRRRLRSRTRAQGREINIHSREPNDASYMLVEATKKVSLLI